MLFMGDYKSLIKMQHIDWNNLGLKGESKQKSFKDICMFLCCRERGVQCLYR